MDSHNRFAQYWDTIAINMLRRLRAINIEKPVLSHYPEGWLNPKDDYESSSPPPARRFWFKLAANGGKVPLPPPPLASVSLSVPPRNAPLDNRYSFISHTTHTTHTHTHTHPTSSTTTYLCKAKFVASGVIRFEGIIVPRSKMPRPQPWAAAGTHVHMRSYIFTSLPSFLSQHAGFLFASARLLYDVPFDPYLDFLFDGEEILYSARMWTSGWDLFSPSQNVLFHYYYRKKSPKVFADTPRSWPMPQYVSQRRVLHILDLPEPAAAAPGERGRRRPSGYRIIPGGKQANFSDNARIVAEV